MSKEEVMGDENAGRSGAGEFVQVQATGEVIHPDTAKRDADYIANTVGNDSWREQQ